MLKEIDIKYAYQLLDIIYKKLKYINNNYQWQDAQPERKFLTVIIA